MSLKKPMRKRVLAVLLLPLLAVLASCKSVNTVEITSDGGAIITMDIVDEEGLLKDLGMTCSDLEDAMSSELGFLGDSADVTFSEITDGCSLEIVGKDVVDGQVLIDDGDTYTFVMSSSDLGLTGSDLSTFGDFDFSFSVVMPGDIVDATEGGTISGNKVTYTSFDAIESGISVPGEKEGSGSGAAKSSSSGAIMWILIGLGVILVAGGVFFLVTRKGGKPDNGAPQYPTYPGAPGYGAQAPGGQAPFAQAPYGAPEAPPPYAPPAPPAPYGAPEGQQFGAPAPQQFNAPAPQQFGAPQGQPFSAPQPPTAIPPYNPPAPTDPSQENQS